MNFKSPLIYDDTKSTKSRREIYISSIGKSLGKEVCCHIDRDNKEVVFEKKQVYLIKNILHIIKKVQKEVFLKIFRFSGIKRKSQNIIFLPQALLKNDFQVMKIFREKLMRSQVDRYISMHLPVKRSKSVRLQKSSLIETTLLRQKDVDSTCLQNHQRYSYYSKSIDATKMRHHIRKNQIKVYEYDATDKNRANKNKGKRDIIHITYTEMNLGSQKSPQLRKSINKSTKSSNIKIKQFHIDDCCDIKDFYHKKQRLVEQNNSKNNWMVGKTYSPYIGKNRIKNSNIDNSCGREFQNIDIDR